APARPVGAPRPITPKDRASAQPVGAPRPITPKDRASAQPVGAPRPITLKDKAPAQPVGVPRPAKAKAPASASLWGAVSPRQLMQRASNAFKASSRSRSKKGKEEAAASASSGGKGGAGQNGQDVATSQEAASTDITTVAVRCQEEQVGAGQPKEKAEAEMSDLQEERPQSSEVVETETGAHERTDDGSPAVVGEAAATPEGEDELATSAAEEKIVEEIQRAEATENSKANANPEEPDQETGVISEEPKEGTSVVSEEPKPKEAADPTTAQKREEASDEPKTAAGSNASAPTTPLTEAANYDGNDDVEATPKQRRSEEEQPKRKEVARSNDVIEEAKSKLMEKRKSKVKALVGAFETVMD
ncbi:hypothetical protein ACJX0J_024201, partial [Zea mays]